MAVGGSWLGSQQAAASGGTVEDAPKVPSDSLAGRVVGRPRAHAACASNKQGVQTWNLEEVA